MDSRGSSDDDASKCPASLLGVEIDVDRGDKEQHGKVHEKVLDGYKRLYGFIADVLCVMHAYVS